MDGVVVETGDGAQPITDQLNEVQHLEGAGDLQADDMWRGARHADGRGPHSIHAVPRAQCYSARMLQSGAAPPAIVRPARRVRGRLRPPGDKSISHRYALLAALAHGRSKLEHFAPGADCAATLACLEALGVAIARFGNDLIEIEGRGLGGLRPPSPHSTRATRARRCGCLPGVLAAHPFRSTIAGDASLSRRPMRRVASRSREWVRRIERPTAGVRRSSSAAAG